MKGWLAGLGGGFMVLRGCLDVDGFVSILGSFAGGSESLNVTTRLIGVFGIADDGDVFGLVLPGP